MAHERGESFDRAPDEHAGRPPGRLTGLGWSLIAALPVLIVVMVIAARGTVATIAFLLVALDVLILATAVLGPPRRLRRRLSRRW